MDPRRGGDALEAALGEAPSNLKGLVGLARSICTKDVASVSLAGGSAGSPACAGRSRGRCPRTGGSCRPRATRGAPSRRRRRRARRRVGGSGCAEPVSDDEGALPGRASPPTPRLRGHRRRAPRGRSAPRRRRRRTRGGARRTRSPAAGSRGPRGPGRRRGVAS